MFIFVYLQKSLLNIAYAKGSYLVESTKVNLMYVPLITFFSGFLSFALLSIYYKVFWVTSNYDIPLIYNVSVMVGDSILLPIFNYMVFNLYFNKLGLRRLDITNGLANHINFPLKEILEESTAGLF